MQLWILFVAPKLFPVPYTSHHWKCEIEASYLTGLRTNGREILHWSASMRLTGRCKKRRDRERREKRNVISLIGSAWGLVQRLEQKGCDTQTAALIKSPTHYQDSISSNVAVTWPNPSQSQLTHTTPKTVDHTYRITQAAWPALIGQLLSWFDECFFGGFWELTSVYLWKMKQQWW